MQPGPIDIYTCSHCECLVRSIGSLVSGNTFGAVYFSDGKREAPMLPDSPAIVACPECHTLLWIHRVEIVYIWYRHLNNWFSTQEDEEEKEKEETRWRKVPIAEFPSIGEYLSALEQKNFISDEEERYIRKRILWAFNDRVRAWTCEPLFVSESEPSIWEQNNDRLLELLDVKEPEQRLLAAEIYRYKGDFQKCKDLVSELNEEKWRKVREAFNQECDKKNIDLFRLR